MTDYDAQYDAYVAAIDTLVKAYNGLQYSFTKIPDGTVFGNGKTNAIERMSILDQGGQYVEGSFTNQGYIFRTKHTPLQVKFGDFNVTFGVLTKQSDAFQLLKNNALDSITINATQPKIAENGSRTHRRRTIPNAFSPNRKQIMQVASAILINLTTEKITHTLFQTSDIQVKITIMIRRTLLLLMTALK